MASGDITKFDLERFDLEIGKMKESKLTSNDGEKNPAEHYQVFYKDILIDPARIAKEYKMTCHMLFFILKKSLMAGRRGYKDTRQDLNDIINAAQRKLAMMDEDGE